MQHGITIYFNLPSSSSRVTELSTYSHQCFPSVETGISQLDHLHARWMHTQAITVGLYWRQKVVRCRLHNALAYAQFCVWVHVCNVWMNMRAGMNMRVSWIRASCNWSHIWRKKKHRREQTDLIYCFGYLAKTQSINKLCWYVKLQLIKL